jgi:2-oxoglutarate dehydrogenase E1 component
MSKESKEDKKMQQESYKVLEENSFLDAENATYLEDLYESYLEDKNSVPAPWARYFAELQPEEIQLSILHSRVQDEFRRLPRILGAQKSVHSETRGLRDSKENLPNKQALSDEKKQMGVGELIEAYRLLGHLHADIDPLNIKQKPTVPELTLSFYQLSEKDLDTLFDAGTLPGTAKRSLRQIIQELTSIYCGSIASEFMHIPDSRERTWLQERVEQLYMKGELSRDIKLKLLRKVSEAEGLEKYLGAKYPGAKRFSLEGLDSFIVMLDELILQGGKQGIKEIVIGMAHRGRLNVLINIFGKNPSQLFDEFEGKHHDERLESGDVKYHQGFSSDVGTASEPIHLSLAFNPSHLEIVVPVVCGSVRARQERRHDQNHEQVLAIGVHGDAAFAGQGVVMETLNMSRTRGFGIGGSIHIVMNNQIGFTTSDPQDSRSTLYCSDIGKMMEVPIFHINANDPEAVYKVAHLAIDYRKHFKKDVIIDLIGYRRQGHNEADEPAATQPLMYKIIRKLPTVCHLYANKLISEGIITTTDAEDIVKDYRSLLDNRKTVRDVLSNGESSPFNISLDWQPFASKDWRVPIKTGVTLNTIKTLAEQLELLPPGFVLHPRVQKLMEERAKMTVGSIPVDWGYAEIMAYATLLNEGYPIRFTGQDCRRGTFFHRHAVLHDQETESEYTPLNHLSVNQAKMTIYDSLLSEEGVLAFEYGYSTTDPRHLVIWEAQFGDFVNGAQVVIDQFISSGEQKWGRLSGLTLFLPHGYEGQGPEHSSARLERFLQLCAEHNIQVCTPTTPAQIFHMIRRQMIRHIRKPLVVMTPKSLLRHKLAVSSLAELEQGGFLAVIAEIDKLESRNVTRVVLCGGKIYYDLLARRRALNNEQVALIRIEQLYPFPTEELQAILDKYASVKDIIWCQEEPQNQGAWYCSQHHMVECLKKDQHLRYVGRKPAAAPAVGYAHLHHEQHEALLKEALE